MQPGRQDGPGAGVCAWPVPTLPMQGSSTESVAWQKQCTDVLSPVQRYNAVPPYLGCCKGLDQLIDVTDACSLLHLGKGLTKQPHLLVAHVLQGTQDKEAHRCTVSSKATHTVLTVSQQDPDVQLCAVRSASLTCATALLNPIDQEVLMAFFLLAALACRQHHSTGHSGGTGTCLAWVSVPE